MTRFLAGASTAFLVVALAAGSARADTTYTDSSGDQEGGPAAVDITTVQLSNDAKTVTLRVALRNPESARASFQFIIWVDFDLDRRSREHEARVLWEAPSTLSAHRCTDGDCDDVPTTGMRASFAGDSLTLTVPLAALDRVPSFGFSVGALNVPAPPGGGDVAPNDDQPAWVYVVGSSTTLSASRPTGSPARPVAGKPFIVRSVVRRSDTGAVLTTGAVACAVTVGSTRVRAPGRFRAGAAECAMTVPRTAKGRSLRGTMTIKAVGTSVRRAFAFRVG